jgi:hypothetical protein
MTENGRSIEDMASNEDLGSEYVEGKRGQLSWEVGGIEPSSSSLSVTGLSKIDLAGEFDKGDVVELRVRVKVGDVNFHDVEDTDGFAIDCEKQFKGKAISVARLSDEEVEALAAVVVG